MTETMFAQCDAVARSLSRSFARTAPFVGLEELQQEAWTKMLEAIPSFDGPAEALHGFLAVAARRALAKMVFRLRAPVSVCGDLMFRDGGADKAAQLMKARVDVAALEPVASAGPTPEVAVADREARRRLAQLVAELLASEREAEAVAAVLFGDLESAQAATAFGLPVTDVYTATREAKRKLARCKRRLSEVL